MGLVYLSSRSCSSRFLRGTIQKKGCRVVISGSYIHIFRVLLRYPSCSLLDTVGARSNARETIHHAKSPESTLLEQIPLMKLTEVGRSFILQEQVELGVAPGSRLCEAFWRPGRDLNPGPAGDSRLY